MTQKASWALWSWHGGESFDDTAHSMRWSPKAMMQWFSRIMGTIHLLPGACRVIPKDWKASNADEFEPGGIRRGSVFTVDFRLGEGWSPKASYSYWYPAYSRRRYMGYLFCICCWCCCCNKDKWITLFHCQKNHARWSLGLGGRVATLWGVHSGTKRSQED